MTLKSLSVLSAVVDITDNLGPNYGIELKSGEAGSDASGNIEAYFTSTSTLTKAGSISILNTGPLTTPAGPSKTGFYHSAGGANDQGYGEYKDTAPADNNIDSDSNDTGYLII